MSSTTNISSRRKEALKIELKVDRRILKSQKAIQNAFCEMLLDIGFDAITVKAITQKADISRKTFYLHYSDKFDLLNAIVDKQLEELTAVCEKKREMGCTEGTVLWFRYFQQLQGFLCRFVYHGKHRFISAPYARLYRRPA